MFKRLKVKISLLPAFLAAGILSLKEKHLEDFLTRLQARLPLISVRLTKGQIRLPEPQGK